MLPDLVKIIHEYCGFNVEFAKDFFETKQHENTVFNDITISNALTDVYLCIHLDEAITEIFTKQKTVLSGQQMYKYFTEFIKYTGIIVNFTNYIKPITLNICKQCFDKKPHLLHHIKEEVDIHYWKVALPEQPTINDLDIILK